MASPSARRCALCRARSTGILCRHAGHILHERQSEIRTRVFARGHLLFYSGTSAHSLFVIRTGRVKVLHPSRRGEEHVLGLLGPGDLVGHRPVLANEPYSSSAQAIEETTACLVPAPLVRELTHAVPALAEALMAELARELRKSEELLINLVHRPVRERAARLLLSLAAELNDGSGGDTIPTTELRRKDMAAMIGTSPETLSRILHGFAGRGWLTLGRAQIRIHHRDPLVAAAGEGNGAA